jgi:hypothetical protein
MKLTVRPHVFLLAGLLWLTGAAIVGLMLFLGMTMGQGHGQGERSLHAHGALIGGVMQIVAGLLLAGRDRAPSSPAIFAALNLGTIGLLAGQLQGRSTLMGVSSLLFLGAFATLKDDLVRQLRHSAVGGPLGWWFYGVALASLAVGLLSGIASPFRLMPYDFLGQGRLAHIHLLTQGFLLLMVVGAMHAQFPGALGAALHSARLAQVTFALLPLGIVVLIAGFLTANLWVQIGAGALMLAGAACYSYNIARTWMGAGRLRRAASDFCLIATVFLVVAIACGIGVSVNFLEQPPFVPFGSLHLAAYTHLAFIGFMLLSILGALTDLLPRLLAGERAPSHKKRGPYEATLAALIARWSPIQLWTLSTGAMGMFVVAALVWQYPLNSPPVRYAAWAGSLLMATGLVLYVVNVAQLLLAKPED